MNILEAKKDYTDSLCDFITPQIYRGIKSIYSDAERLSFRNEKKVLLKFQKLLENIPQWDTATLSIEYDRICQDSNCDYLDDLITAVFVCHTKVLTAVKLGSSKTNIDLNVPNGIEFLHKCYIEVARKFWENPRLFSTQENASQYQKNMRKSSELIVQSIRETIRNLLPIESIIKQYLKNIQHSDNISITSDMLHENIQNSLRKDIDDSESVHSDIPLQKFIHSSMEEEGEESEEVFDDEEIEDTAVYESELVPEPEQEQEVLASVSEPEQEQEVLASVPEPEQEQEVLASVPEPEQEQEVLEPISEPVSEPVSEQEPEQEPEQEQKLGVEKEEIFKTIDVGQTKSNTSKPSISIDLSKENSTEEIVLFNDAAEKTE